MPSLALTGVTGRLGGRVATRLAAAGATPRLLVRHPARAPDLPGCEVAVASYADADAARRASSGAPDWQVTAWVSTYLAIAAGELAEVTDDVPRLAGHPARSLEDLLQG